MRCNKSFFFVLSIELVSLRHNLNLKLLTASQQQRQGERERRGEVKMAFLS